MDRRGRISRPRTRQARATWVSRSLRSRSPPLSQSNMATFSDLSTMDDNNQLGHSPTSSPIPENLSASQLRDSLFERGILVPTSFSRKELLRLYVMNVSTATRHRSSRGIRRNSSNVSATITRESTVSTDTSDTTASNLVREGPNSLPTVTPPSSRRDTCRSSTLQDGGAHELSEIKQSLATLTATVN